MDSAAVSRVVELSEAFSRGSTRDDCTRFVPHRVRPQSHRERFNLAQRQLARDVLARARPGVCVFAVSEGGAVDGQLWLSASSRLRAGVLGRHSAVDLFLPRDAGLSLRHLVIQVSHTRGAVRFRVSDLATSERLTVGEGVAVDAVEADGPLVLGVAGHSVFIVVTGVRLPWDPAAADPWSTLPEPSFVAPAVPRVKRMLAGSTGDVTHVTLAAPAVVAKGLPLVQTEERAVGTLVLSGRGLEETLVVGAAALDGGVLIGRYERCSGGLELMDDRVSRVHAMVVRVGGLVHVLDLGSTNGVFRQGEPVKCAPMEPGVEYRLGESVGVRWENTGA